jgi:hypothetical protein
VGKGWSGNSRVDWKGNCLLVSSGPSSKASRDDLRHLLREESPVDTVETVIANETDLLGAIWTRPNEGLEVPHLTRDSE